MNETRLRSQFWVGTLASRACGNFENQLKTDCLLKETDCSRVSDTSEHHFEPVLAHSRSRSSKAGRSQRSSSFSLGSSTQFFGRFFVQKITSKHKNGQTDSPCPTSLHGRGCRRRRRSARFELLRLLEYELLQLLLGQVVQLRLERERLLGHRLPHTVRGGGGSDTRREMYQRHLIDASVNAPVNRQNQRIAEDLNLTRNRCANMFYGASMFLLF